MGMDVSGLDPKIKGEKPKYPENYEELSDKEQQAYWDEVNYFMKLILVYTSEQVIGDGDQ